MLTIFHKLVWGAATTLLLFVGLTFTWKLRFVQFHFRKMFRSIFEKKKDKKGVSPFEALMIVLAGRIGVGSIAGVALAIYLGGIGSIFWMWVMGFLSASLAFVETYLGVHFKEKDDNGLYKGGPSYYIEKGLKNKKLAFCYAILVLFTNVAGFLSIQSNTIVKAVNQIYPVPPIWIALILMILTAFIIFGGVKKIVATSSKLVPFMTMAYLLVAFFVLLKNLHKIPFLVTSIIKEAFALNPFLGGFLFTMMVGIQRGIFSNEGGLGTGAIASSITTENDGRKAGYVQMLGIYITTFLVCSATAIVILTSPYQTTFFSDVNGIEITQYAFFYHFGKFGLFFIFLSIVLFSFSTILAGYYDGESCLKFIKKKVQKKDLFCLKVMTLFLILWGCLSSSVKLWNFVDTLVAFLAFINVYALYKLRHIVYQKMKK